MPSQKLVRCGIRPVEANRPASPRYVPLEIFGLWEYLMASKHGFEVVDARASLWLDMEDSPEAAYGEHQFERVTEITAFVFSERDEMFTRARRYFPTNQVEKLKEIFLSHYGGNGSKVQSQVHERPGIWVYREMAQTGSSLDSP